MLTSSSDWPADPAFASIFPLLAPDRMLSILRKQLPSAADRDECANCKAIESLYDPGKQICVAYVLSADPAMTVERAWPEGDIVYLRYPVRRPMSRRGTICTVDGHDLELYSFPNDRRLRGLRKFARRESMINVWQQWLREDEPALSLQPDTLRRQLIRYVPEQKWIVHFRSLCHDAVAGESVKRSLAVRAAPASVCKSIYHRMIELRRAMPDNERGFQISKPVALDAHAGLLAVRWAWGKSLIDMLKQLPVSDVMARVAAGLDHLHHTPLTNLKAIAEDDFLDVARECVSDIAAVMPARKMAGESVLSSLVKNRPSAVQAQFGTIHGDFHFKQLLIKNNRYSLLDLEQCAGGDPWFDVATFAAQLAMLAVRPDMGVSAKEALSWRQAFLSAWESTTRASLNVPRLQWYSAIALLILGRGMLRHLRPGWPAFVDHCIEQARRTIHQNDLETVP